MRSVEHASIIGGRVPPVEPLEPPRVSTTGGLPVALLKLKRFPVRLEIAQVAVLVPMLTAATSANDLSPMEELGKMVFVDEYLSTPPGMSCAVCHTPDAAWTGPGSAINAAGAADPGVIATRADNRKPSTLAHGGDSPVLYSDEAEELRIGGIFWNGRPTGWTLGAPWPRWRRDLS